MMTPARIVACLVDRIMELLLLVVLVVLNWWERKFKKP
jgi:hypothetical protein